MSDIKELQFTKRWTSPTDFPTYEPDETRVRQDLQALHDETAEYINEELIPGVKDYVDRYVSAEIPNGSVGSEKLADYMKAPLVAVLNR